MKTITSLLTSCFIFLTSITMSYAQCDSNNDIIQDTGTVPIDAPVLIGQYISASCSGEIGEISIFTSNVLATRNVQMTVYRGVVVSTTNLPPVIGSQTVTMNPSTTLTEHSFVFNTPLELLPGEVFSILLNTTANVVNYTLSGENPYPNGTAFFISPTGAIGLPTADLRFKVSYNDTRPPNPRCKDATIALNEDGEAFLLVEDIDDGSTGGVIIRSLSKDTFTCDDLGEQTVTLSVGDSAGNFDTCEATVTVVDNLPPVNNSCQDITVNNDPNRCTTRVNYLENLSPTDNCGIVIVDIVTGPNPDSVFPVGTTEIEYLLRDQSGNTSSCSFTVTVIDNEPPSITPCEDIIVNSNPGECTAIVNYADLITVSDNCDIDTLNITGLPSGSAFPIGDSVIEYEVTDVNGLTSNCSFTITVVNDEALVISCPADVTIDCADARTTSVTGTSTEEVEIPDDNNAGINSTISLSTPIPDTHIVTDMSVELSMDHTWTGDLTFELIAPNGETLLLYTRPSGIGDSSDLNRNFPITFTDDATTDANLLGVGIGGSNTICQTSGSPCEYFPSGNTNGFEQFIATLNAANIDFNGDWTLHITDDQGGDEGNLFSWNIHIESFDSNDTTPLVIDTTPASTGMATATDTCGDVTVTFNDVVVDGCGISETITRTWTATSTTGNTSTCVQTITVTDTRAPELISCPEDIVFEIAPGDTEAIISYDLPEATDICSDITITQTEGIASGEVFPVGITTNTFSITDDCGNETICSFTVNVTTQESLVSIDAGILTIEDIGTISDDTITLSDDGTTLTISNLTSPVIVQGGPVAASSTSVTVNVADITNGIVMTTGGGTNTVTVAAATGGSTLDISGDDTATIAIDAIDVGSLIINGFTDISDVGGAITVTGTTTLIATNEIIFEDGQGNHTFGAEVTLQANKILFTAGATTTFDTITTTTTDAGIVNEITVSPGDIIFNGDVTISGSNANLFVCGIEDISQTSGSIEAPFLVLRGNGNTTASLDNDNNIQALGTSNPFDADAVNLASLSFTNSNNMFLEIVHVDEFDLTAPEFDLEPNFTVITKEGTGESNFNANIDVNTGTGTVRINHNAGTINFNGDTNDFISQMTYTGQSGTVTNINSTTTNFPQGGPNRSFTFGTINGSGAIEIGDLQFELLDGANFSGASTLLSGFPNTIGGPTVISNNATVTPSAVIGFGLSYNFSNLVMNTGATFAPLIEGVESSNRDRLSVNGTVTLSDANLAPFGGFTIQVDQEVILINNDGVDSVEGTFNNLPEGAGIAFGEFLGIISYVGGDGNDVVLLPDTIDPVAICQDITLSVGIDGITVIGDQLNGGSTDNAEISEFLINGETSIDFTLADLGDNEVIITVVDSSGNTADCTATITLVSNVNATLPILISEFQPLPEGANDLPNQTIEIKGEPGESFVGTFVIVDGSQNRSDRGLVVHAFDLSGIFNAEGIITTSVLNFTNPSHTAILTSAFNGDVDVTDIDTDNDGTADDLSAFGDIFDAVGVQDGGICCPINVVYGTDFGGIDLASIGSPPAAIFRDASEGEYYQINNSGTIYDSNGTIVDASAFNNTPTIDGTFGVINPSITSQVIVSPTLYLQGAFTNPNAGEETLMRDDLRVGGLIPLATPYSDEKTIEATVLNTTGANAVVDWVFVELRDATDNTIVINGQSALLLRDGSVVNTDGTSPLSFEQEEGSYHVAINHRNHLGVITATTVALSSMATTLDFGSDITIANGGTLALRDMGSGIFAVYAGDATGDGNILNTDITNTISVSGGINVYNGADTNMDGNILNDDIALFIQLNAGRIQQF